MTARNRFLPLLLLLAGVMAACSPAGESEAKQSEGPSLLENQIVTTGLDEAGTVRVALRAWPSVLRIGDRVHLELSYQAPDGVVLLNPPDELDPLTLINVDPLPAGEERRREGWMYETAAFELGALEIGPLELRFADRSGEEIPVSLEPLELQVVPLISEGADVEPADIRGPVGIPFDWGKVAGTAVAIFLGVLGGIFFLWLLARLWPSRRRGVTVLPPAPLEPAHVVARRRLQALREAGPPGPGRAKPWYVELSETLREYVENRFGVEALERTTEEMTFLVRKLGVPRRRTDALLQWLMRCDMVKFAKQEPPPGQTRADLEEAIRFVEDTAPREEQASAREEAV